MDWNRYKILKPSLFSLSEVENLRIFFFFFYISLPVPPDIVDTESSSVVSVDEGGAAQLVCHARGNPPPTITWSREDDRKVPNNAKVMATGEIHDGTMGASTYFNLS